MNENNSTKQQRCCPKCGHHLSDDKAICPYCRAVVNRFDETNAKSSTCATCGRDLKASDMYCPSCGTAKEVNDDPTRIKRCGICKKFMPINERYCSSCGCDKISVGLYKKNNFSLAKPKKEMVDKVSLFACLACLITLFVLVFTPIASIKVTLLGVTEKMSLSMFSHFGENTAAFALIKTLGLSANTVKMATFISYFTMASLIACVGVAIFFLRKLTRSVAIFNLIVNIVLVVASSIMMSSMTEITKNADILLSASNMLGAEVSEYYGGIGMFVVSLLSLISSLVFFGVTLDRVGDKEAIRAHKKKFIFKVIACVMIVSYVFQMSLLLGWSSSIASEVDEAYRREQTTNLQYELDFSPVYSSEFINYRIENNKA